MSDSSKIEPEEHMYVHMYIHTYSTALEHTGHAGSKSQYVVYTYHKMKVAT